MTAKNPQHTAHESHLAEATKQYIDSLTALGVKTFVVGYALSDDPEGEGVVIMQGTSMPLLNLIGATIQRFIPQDFHNLLVLMQASDFFAANRGEKSKPAKKELVN